MSRTKIGLEKAIKQIKELQFDFQKNVKVSGEILEFNQELDKASRLVDFFEIAELMCLDALQRNESCGAHFREEYQTAEGEALRNDDEFSYVSAWEFIKAGEFRMHKEVLNFEFVKPSVRSYK